MRRIIALTSGALLLAAALPSMAATPTVTIETTFTEITSGQEAAVFPGSDWTNSGSFTATPADSPTNHGEWKILGPEYTWTISPDSSDLTFDPRTNATVNLDLLNSNAWGYVYTITNIVTWSESNIVTHAVQPAGAATNSILLDAMMAEIYEIGNVCPKGPHDSHDVYVAISPDGLELPLTLNLISQSDGAAVFDDTSTEETTIYESQWVTLDGVTASDFTNDLAMTADFGEGACVSENFTVYDVDTLSAYEDLHTINSKSSSSETNDVELEICQLADGSATLNFSLDYWPVDADGSKFRWDMVRADNDEASEEWYATSFDFGAGEVSADWVPDDPATATREFKLRAWFDCDQAGIFDTNYPNRQMTVRVVDLDTLFLTDATDDNNFIWDYTRTNETMSTTNTLYLGEDTNGTARMYLDLSWLPTNSDATNFWYDILQTNGTTRSAQWSSSNGTFSANSSVLVTWTNSASGQTNRSFIVNAWYDCNHNGTNDVDEPHRQLFVNVQKAEVTNIKFNWKTDSSTNDAINIRQNYTTNYDISNGEWVKGVTNIPACYTTNKAVTIKARFTVQPASITSADIWALSTDSGGSLGDVIKTNVTFSGGVSSPEYVTFQVSGTTPNCIQKTTNDVWQWKMENVNGTGSAACNLNTSGVHTVYTILNEPVSPWDNTFNTPSNAWTEVLDYSCKWAANQATRINAASKITEAFFACGRFKYDVNNGIHNYTEGPHEKGTVFNLTKCVERLDGGAGKNELVNCTDCANAVVIFANILGDDLKAHYLGHNPVLGFLCNKFTAIGCAAWTPPNWSDPLFSFSYHAVAWRGNADAMDGKVYDACLQVDDDADPTVNPPANAKIPTEMIFWNGDAAFNSYREKLVAPGVYDNCVPVSGQFFFGVNIHGWCWQVPIE